MSAPLLAICVATFRRPLGLRRLVESLRAQGRGPLARAYRLELRVVDNSPEGGAGASVGALQALLDFPLRYRHEPEPNIARARNAALELGPAAVLAFVDDDEVAAPGWLEGLLDEFLRSDADAVLGAVERELPAQAPSWIHRGAFFAGVEPRGDLGWCQTRTGNTLVAGNWVYGSGFRFDEAFGRSGGEDTQFFSRLEAAGARFRGAPRARVAEGVEPGRLNPTYLLGRAFRQGVIVSRVRAGLRGERHPLLTCAARLLEGCAGLLVGVPLALCGRPERGLIALARLSQAAGGIAGWLAPLRAAGTPAYGGALCASRS